MLADVEVDLVVTERQRRLGVAAVALACFALLTVLVRQHATRLAGLDAQWHASMHAYGLAHPGWVTATRAVTRLGDTITFAVVAAAVVVACVVRRRPRVALFAVGAAVLTWAIWLAMRGLVARPRPDDGFWPSDDLAFPSGHTTNAAAMAIIVVVAAWPYLSRRWRAPVLAVAVAVPLLVGLSGVAGGAQWPSDVLGGLLLAVATTTICAALTLPASFK
jgi:membrane-associated phospholipid phosphatase